MGLRDYMDEVDEMKQTSDYKEEIVKNPNSNSNSKVVSDFDGSSKPSSESFDGDELNPNAEVSNDEEESKSSRKLPKLNLSGTKMIPIILIGVIAVGGLGYLGYTSYIDKKDKELLSRMEEEDTIPAFQYTEEERVSLRMNGYTGDEIELFAIEERPVDLLIQEAELLRKQKNDEEIKPYLDGASSRFKKLLKYTWVGQGPMSNDILNKDEFEDKYGTYNCDYVKIPAHGSQLFLKLENEEFNSDIFMMVNAMRYNELNENGNIVVQIDYQEYPNGGKLVTNVVEKDIEV